LPPVDCSQAPKNYTACTIFNTLSTNLVCRPFLSLCLENFSNSYQKRYNAIVGRFLNAVLETKSIPSLHRGRFILKWADSLYHMAVFSHIHCQPQSHTFIHTKYIYINEFSAQKVSFLYDFIRHSLRAWFSMSMSLIVMFDLDGSL
jgi:hypothetical protein